MNVPYWRLSSFYFAFFALVGVMIPYWGLYLKSLGFTPAEIGELMALLMATKVVAPNVWGSLADRSGRHMQVVRVATVLALIFFCGVFLGQGYWWMMVVMCLYGFFWNAALPQFEATTMSMLGEQVHRYGSIRMWGSVGFIVMVVALGPLLDRYGAGMVAWALLGLLVALVVAALVVPARRRVSTNLQSRSIWDVMRRKEVVVVLLVCFLLQASHGPYYTFYTLYLEEVGYSRSAIGQLWALGVVAEIAIFLVMHRLLPQYGPKLLLMWSLGLTALRWVLIGEFADSLPLLLFAQLLHAASFGVYHAVAIHLVHRFFTEEYQGRGQALYSSISFGAGGAFGALASGYLWAGIGAAGMYVMAGAVSAVAFFLAWRGLDGKKL